jgi:hypothetical protein
MNYNQIIVKLLNELCCNAVPGPSAIYSSGAIPQGFLGDKVTNNLFGKLPKKKKKIKNKRA